MANVKEYLDQIMRARFGRDVRQSIHDSIEAINTQVTESEQGVRESAEAAESAKEAAESAAGNAMEQVMLAANQVGLAEAQVTLAKGQVALAEAAKTAAEEAAQSVNVSIATTEIAGVVKPDGITITIDPDGTIHGNSQVDVDDQLSKISENPVQNKVVTNEIASIKESLPTKIQYDQDAELLSMYAGDTLISSTTIVASGGGGGGGGGIELAEPTGVVIVGGDEEATITWTDPEDLVLNGVTLAKWGGTVVVRKAGSAPTKKSDGTIVVDSRTRDAYKTTGFKDPGLVNGTKYYYGVFPYSTGGTYTCTKNVNVTPAIIYPSAATISEAKGDNAKVTLTYTLPSGITSAELYWHTANTVSDTVYTGTKGITGTTVDVTGLTNDTEYFFAIYTVNAKGRKKKSEVVSATPADLKIVSFADGTWDEISDMLDAHYAGRINIADYWSVGDVKTGVPLSTIAAVSPLTDTHNAQNIDLVIIGIEHDDLASAINGKTKAAITLSMKDCLNTKGRIHSSSNPKIRWTTSPRKTWMSSFKSALPSTLSNIIKTVTKVSVYFTDENNTLATETSSEQCFLPSNWEVFGKNYRDYITEQDGTQYDYYKTQSNRVKKVESSANNWWIRSCYWGIASSYNFFIVGDAQGYAFSTHTANANGLSVCMCL